MTGLSSALFTIQNLLYIKSSIMSEDKEEVNDVRREWVYVKK